jgi:opacity protein-like surface antigen
MNKKIALLASTALMVAATTFPAEAGNFYVRMFGGANWVADSDFTALAPSSTTDSLSWSVGGDTGWVVGGAIGYDLNEILRGWKTELEFSYRENKREGDWSSLTSTGTGNGQLSFDHSTFAVMANAWYEFPIGGIAPYVGGGIGWARSTFKGDYINGLSREPFDFDNSGFAWQLGAGVNFPIKPGMSMGLGYRYFRGPEVNALSFGNVSGCCTNNAQGDVDTESHSVLLNLDVSL